MRFEAETPVPEIQGGSEPGEHTGTEDSVYRQIGKPGLEVRREVDDLDRDIANRDVIEQQRLGMPIGYQCRYPASECPLFPPAQPHSGFNCKPGVQYRIPRPGVEHQVRIAGH